VLGAVHARGEPGWKSGHLEPFLFLPQRFGLPQKAVHTEVEYFCLFSIPLKR
jgi:hypothetical protein